MDRRNRRLQVPVVGEPRSPQENGASGEAASAWALFVTLGTLKLVLVLIIVAMYPTHEAVLVQVVTSWPWLAVPAIFLAAPTVFWYRRLRVRARRKRLLEAEWRND
jgi:Flp pilus assembly protein TadB